MTTQPSASDAAQDGRSSQKSVVAVVRTTPDRVLDDTGAAMRMAGYQQVLPHRQPRSLEDQHLLAALVPRLLHLAVAA